MPAHLTTASTAFAIPCRISLLRASHDPIFHVYRCVLQKMPQDVDLVILDFGVNDYQAHEYLR